MCRQRGTQLILHCRPGALELLLTKQVDEIFIATLERDLALAVLRLVELGVPVIWIGEAKAPQSFRKACRSSWHCRSRRNPARCLPPLTSGCAHS